MALATATLTLAGSPALGDVITWDGDTDTDFATADNWVGGVAPASSTTIDSALFLGSAQSDRPVLTSNRAIMGVDFQSAGWTLSGGSTLTVGANGIDSAGAGTNAVSANVTQNVAATWTIGAGNTLDLGGVFGGLTSGSLDLAGSGTLRFTGSAANTFAGTITIGSGATLEIDKTDVAAIANGRSAVVNGTVKWLQAGVAANTAQFTVNTGGVVDTNGYDASFAFSGNERITLAGGTVQTGAGTWTFTGNNATYATVNGTSVSTISGSVNFGSALIDRGVTIANNAAGVDLNWAADIVAGKILYIAGSAAGSGSEVILSGNNQMAGGVRVSNGVTVYLDSATALGAITVSGNNHTVSSDSTLALRGSINYAAPGSVQMTYSVTPGLRSVSGNNTWNGAITNPGGSNNTPAHIQVDADTLTMNGSLAAFSSTSRQLAKTGAGALVYNNAGSNIAATLYVNDGVFAQAPSGEVNTRNGNTTLNGGTIASPDDITLALGTGNNQMRFGAEGGGFAAYGADINVNIGSIATVVWGGATNGQSPTVTRTSNVVTSLSGIYFGGAGYNGSETVSVTGGGGSGAAATATFLDGVLVGYELTAGGENYTGNPTFSVIATGDGGTANFLANDAPLILNSAISQHKVTLVDNINLANAAAGFTGQREIRVLDNAASSNDRAVIAGVISSSKAGVGVSKTGAGVLEYAAAVTQTYSGVTAVTDGTLLVNGTHSGAGAYSVSSAVLGGTGTIGGDVNILADGVLAPGDGGIESLDVSGNLSLNGTGASDTATLQIQIGPSSAADLLVIGGDLNLGTFDHLAVTGTADGGAYTIATFVGTLTGTFDTTALPGGYEVVYNSNSISIEMVPEPGSLGVIAAGALGLLQRRRRRRERP